MPPKRIAKRRSPPEDALPKSKKVKGKLALSMGGLLAFPRIWYWAPSSLRFEAKGPGSPGTPPSWRVSCSSLIPTLWE